MNRMRIAALLVMALLLCVVAVATAAAADEPAPTAPITPNSPETEPNDDLDTATNIDWDTQRHGKIDPVGDVDFYRFYTNLGNSFMVDYYQPATSPLRATLSLYDGEGTLLMEADCVSGEPCLQFVSNDYEYRYLKVSALDDAGGPAFEYRLTLTYLGEADPNEPNDFASEATPITYDDWHWGKLEPCGDMDYFTFEGQAGQELRIQGSWWYVTRLLDHDLNLVAESGYDHYDFVAVLPDTGTYYLELYRDRESYCGWGYDLRLHLVRQPVYLSLNKAGTVQGIPFTSGDVLRYWLDTGEFEMYIDMSDLGLSGNLTALGYGHDDWCWWDCGYTFLLGFAAKYSHPDLGTVQPQDLVALIPDSTGADTDGWLTFAFDGSDVSLTTLNERIDAVAMPRWFYEDLLISTAGQAKVPNDLGSLAVQDEDLLDFYSDMGFYTDTAGLWWHYFDGSQYGLGAVDVIGADIDYEDYDRYGDAFWLAFDKAKTLDGINFAPGDIAECFVSWYDDDGLCDAFTKLFDASDAGLAGFKVDAFEVGPKE